MFDEAGFITERVNQQIATEAMLVQMAVHSLLSQKMQKQFEKHIKKLTGDGE